MENTLLSGNNFLKDFLGKNTCDFSTMNLENFVVWLKKQVAQKSTDPSFYKRCEIRDLQYLHRSRFYVLWDASKKAQQAWDSCASKEKWESVERKIFGSKRAIEGLSLAIQEKSGEKRLDCMAKLEAFQKELGSLEQQREEMLKSLQQKHDLDKAESELFAFKQEIGLDKKEKELEEILHAQGQNTSQAGSHFENIARDAIEKYIFPIVSENLPCEQKASLKLLSNVTLGCARAEIDYLVVLPSSPFTIVLAIVEVKRNINDLAWGFQVRQENLAWFTGDTARYDPQLYRTHIFQEGHFDKSVCHEEQGEKFFFCMDSFSLFQREKSCFLDRLFFITDARTLTGMLSSEYRKFLYHISTDMNFDMENPEYLEKLFAWTKTIVSPFQTKHALELYASQEKWARQIIFFSRKNNAGEKND